MSTYYLIRHSPRVRHGRYYSTGHAIDGALFAPDKTTRALCGLIPNGGVDQTPLAALPTVTAMPCARCRAALAKRLAAGVAT